MDMEMLHKIEPKIRRMEYRPAFGPLTKAIGTFVSDGSADPIDDKGNLDGERQDEVAALTAHLRDLEQQLKDQEISFQHKLEASTATAFEQGRTEEDSYRRAMITRMAGSINHALGEFITVRDHYLAQVEQEVVRLALSIATRILHREVQMDPLLLSGAVRVALGQLSDTTEVRLRIPASQYELWREVIHLMPNLPLRPQLVSDETLQAGECSLETHLGSVELGMKAQLAEIERGFFDLLEHREPLRRDDVNAGVKVEEA